MASETKLQDIIQTSLENIRTVIDADTIIGTAISTPQGATIIPISKISVGFATGGMDYHGKKQDPSKNPNFGGAGGTGMSVTPVGFLVVDKDGTVSMLQVDNNGQKDIIGQIADFVESSPEIVGKIKKFFNRKKAKKDKDNTEEETVSANTQDQEPQKEHE